MKHKELIKNDANENQNCNIKVQSFTASSWIRSPHSYHYHNSHEIIIVQRGTLKVLIDRVPKEINANDILVFGQSLPHGIIDFSADIAGIILHISYELLSSVITAIPDSVSDMQFMEKLQYGYLFQSQSLAKKTVLLCKKIAKSDGFLKLSHLFLLLNSLSQHTPYELLTTNQDNHQEKKFAYETPVERTFRFLYAHFQENLTLDAIADYANSNASALCRSFKQASGYTIFQFINRLRIEKACSLLAVTDLNITQIAYQVGFNSLAHFHTQFKKITNTLPNAYKKMQIHAVSAGLPERDI